VISIKQLKRSWLCRSIAVILVAFVVTTFSAAGCASTKKSPDANAASQLGDNGDARFAAGANEKPTAKTMSAMAKILISKGRDRDAVNLLNQTIQQFPDFVPAYNELAGIYLRSNRSGDAVDVLHAALKRAPGDPVLQNNLGLCFFLKGDYEHALASFERAATAQPSNGLYRANEAAALGMLGRDSEATRRYEGVIRDPSIAQNLDVLRRARAQRAVVTPPAEEAAQKPQEQAPTTQEARS
jgi:Flp pilus assembly protein TadD